MKTAFLVTPIAKDIPKLDVDYIALDTACYTLKEKGFKISCIIGDFDSQPFDEKDFSDIKILTYPKRKNETDSELAIHYCLEQGYSSIILWGGISNRLDHTFINLELMKKTKGKLILQDQYHECRYLEKGTYTFSNDYQHFSIFAQEPSSISLKGFEYELDHRDIDKNDLYLVSNSIREKGILTLHSGSIVVIQSNQK